jgi:hypothetical protein
MSQLLKQLIYLIYLITYSYYIPIILHINNLLNGQNNFLQSTISTCFKLWSATVATKPVWTLFTGPP